MAKFTEQESEEAKAELRKRLKPGDRVFTVLRHRSSSGMFRVIDLVIVAPETYINGTGKVKREYAPRSIGMLAAKAMQDGFDRDRWGIKASGCGMDMGFALVYNLGAALWPKGTKEPHGTRNGEPDRSGGYALKHSWL